MTNFRFFLEFKSTHPMGIIFNGIRFGLIFSLLKDLFHNVKWTQSLLLKMWGAKEKICGTLDKNF